MFRVFLYKFQSWPPYWKLVDDIHYKNFMILSVGNKGKIPHLNFIVHCIVY